MLNEKDLPALIGGRAEIQNSCQRFRRRGEIKSLRLEGTRLVADFDWVEKNDVDADSDEWTEDPRLTYTTDLGSYGRVNLGSGIIRLNSRTRNEVVTLSPASLAQTESVAAPMFVEEDELQVVAA